MQDEFTRNLWANRGSGARKRDKYTPNLKSLGRGITLGNRVRFTTVGASNSNNQFQV